MGIKARMLVGPVSRSLAVDRLPCQSIRGEVGHHALLSELGKWPSFRYSRQCPIAPLATRSTPATTSNSANVPVKAVGDRPAPTAPTSPNRMRPHPLRRSGVHPPPS